MRAGDKMKYIEKESRDQITVMPDIIEDYVGADNPVRVIDAFVNTLDMAELGFKKAEMKETGRPPYDPRDLLKLYVYGYFNKIRSSRRLMTECTRNVELFYLLGKLVPDFRTIANFRRDNKKALRQVFRAFVKLCVKLGLYQRELVAVDGTKIRAQNSKDNCYNEEILVKKLAHIDEKLSEYLSAMDEADRTEDSRTMTAEQVKEAVAQLTERRGLYNEYLSECGKAAKHSF